MPMLASSRRAPGLAPVTAGQLSCTLYVMWGCVTGPGAVPGGFHSQPSSLSFARRIRNDPLESPGPPVPGSVVESSGTRGVARLDTVRDLQVREISGDPGFAVAPLHTLDRRNRVGDGFREAMLEVKKLQGALAVADDRLALGAGARPGEGAPHLAGQLEPCGFLGVVEDVDAVVFCHFLVVETVGQGRCRNALRTCRRNGLRTGFRKGGGGLGGCASAGAAADSARAIQSEAHVRMDCRRMESPKLQVGLLNSER